MTQVKTCSISGCIADQAYAIISKSGIHRITFSRSLAQYVLDKLSRSDYTLERVKFTLGNKLKPGEISPSGLYAIVSSKTDWVLRITLFPELADYFNDNTSRYIATCWILRDSSTVCP